MMGFSAGTEVGACGSVAEAAGGESSEATPERLRLVMAFIAASASSALLASRAGSTEGPATGNSGGRSSPFGRSGALLEIPR